MRMTGLHALADRVVFAVLGGWEARRHADSGHLHEYFASRGFLHLQLWHPCAGVSILTPSRLTRDRFEICREGTRIAVRAWKDVVGHLPDLALPGSAEITALCRWTVERDAAAAAAAVGI
ncbi:MAG: hypothetical protein KIT31_38040 [Deltaproteobacteria bacterium]|nr:hypothetical protein [Deltaproteobacteria bacterium]